jgi:hypothetical protein
MKNHQTKSISLHHKYFHFIYALCSLLILLLLASCGGKEYTSRWRKGDITIDGKNTEWRDSLIVIDDKETSVGIVNDDEFLYIFLTSTDRGVARQILMRGLTLWFDRDGGNDKKFGIRYPLGMAGNVARNGGRMDADSVVTDNRREQMARVPDELEIYNSAESEPHRMAISESGGIEAKYHMSEDTLVYELKVPLTDNMHPFAIGAKAGSFIGVGLDSKGTGEMQRPRGEGEENRAPGGGYGGRRGVGMGGGGGRRGGFGGGSNRPGTGVQPEPLDVWGKLKLAEKDLSSQ